MFIKLTHGLHSIIKAIVSYIQKWTDDSVPDGTKTLHNFKDGQSKRPAIPLDEINASNNIINVKTDSKFENCKENLTNSENVFKVELKTELVYGNDDISNKTGIESTTCVPEPIIFEISNEVPEKIEKIIPIKTQALPGQDFIFQILYVKDYNYIEGDILPVFGSWGNYVRLSRDGKYLTVNSSADLTVRLILTPAPQDWIPELPDPGIIQQQGDRMLNTIPRDGSKAYYNIEKTEINDHFYTVSIENQATNFVTNSEFSNGKYYTVNVATKKITIPITFTEGFDENAIYWKCYDDPKSATPVTGSYPSKDYNEEFGPLPSGYRKLQYIYPNNNAYIDLGIKLKANYKVKVLMNLEERNDNSFIGLFGARNSKDTNFYNDNHTNGAYACYVRYDYNNIGFQRGSHRYYFTNSDNPNGTIRWFYSTGTTFEYQDYNGTVKRRLTAAASENIDTEWNCYLFTVNDMGTPYSYGARGKLYRFEMWDENDNLLMRLIPAKNYNTGSCGLYDIINDKFYYNRRLNGYFSGAEFYVWQKPMQCSDHNVTMYLENNDDVDYNKNYDIPAGYQKVYEIYSKERRLDTGYKIKKDDRVECCATVDNNTNSSYRVLFGSRQSSLSDDNYFFFTRFNSSNVACYGKNARETRGTTMTYGKPCKFVAEPYSLSCYNIQNELEWKIDVDGGTSVDCRYNCWLGCGNNNGSIDSWCYAHYHYFRVYDKDNNLVVNMIPARRLSDGVLGFYDIVRNGFYTSDAGNYDYEYKTIYKGAKRILHIENIHKDINLGIIRNPVYDDPFKLEDCIEDEPQNEPKDSLTYSYEITDSKILDYFYVVSTTNNATDYVSVDASYRTANLGNNASFTLTYKQGYDNYDIKATPNTTADVEITKALYITYNELDIPSEYTPVKGLCNSNNGQVYIKTGYIPKWNDKIVCYSSISNNYYTYLCYVFGCRNGEGNKSFVFYGRRNYDGYMSYDRCCSVTNIRTLISNELMKITADNNGCEVDFAYTKTKINTTMPKNVDYNPDITLPTGYTKLACLRNTGRSYINTGIILKQTYKTECIFNITADTSYTWVGFYGAESGSENQCYSIYSRSGNNRRFCYTLGNKDNVASSNYELNKVYRISTDNTAFNLYDMDSGILVQTIVPQGTPADTRYNCWLFGINRSNSLYGSTNTPVKIYSFKIYNENDELISYMIPARRNSDGVLGMYDNVRNTFYTNSGWDSFSFEPTEWNCDYEMYLFNCNHANSKQYSFYGNIYKFTAYDGEGNIKVNLVPVKRLSDNQLGFYDTIRQVFVIPENGTLTESIVPTYKSSMVVTDIPSDTYVTIAKNNNARKNIYLEQGIEDDVFHQQIDQLDYNYEIKETSISDWFYTVKYINQASIRCSIAGGIATYYNTPRVGSSTKFPVTYNIGYDYETINATATAGATAEIKESMKIVYNQVPDEYIKLYGLYNHNSSTYFEIPYIIKDNDSIKLYVKDEKYSNTYWIFGADYNNSTARVLCSKYDSGNNMYYQSGNTRINIAGPANEVLEIDCKPSEINYTTGYDDYHYTLSNTPVDCTGYLHVFGTRNYSSGHYSSFFGTIYKFTIYDDNGVRINLIPVKRKVDNALGFYDTIQDQFYLPSSGSVTEVPQPKMKGKIVISNISNDTDFTVTEKPFTSTINISDDDVVTHSYNFEGCSLQDYWYYIELTNTTNGEVTFTGMNYGNCYIVRPGNDITLSCTYKAGRSSADFIVSEGTLTNNGITLTNINTDKKITIMLNDYHDPKSDTEDDLNIFTNPDFSEYNQYRVVNGSDLMLSSYTFINSQIAAMTNRQIFEFNENELDILSFNPSNVPGNNIKSKIVTTDSNLSEVVQNVTIGGKLMYKHTVTLRNQIKLETGKVYMFKVRDNTDTGKLIAYAKDTGPSNLVNSNGEYTIVDDNVFFDWNEANKYIVQGNKTIYFELNGLKL